MNTVEFIHLLTNIIIMLVDGFIVVYLFKINNKINKTENKINDYDGIILECKKKIELLEWQIQKKY
ncbi:MAG: hypothetical protein LBM02_10080 [Lachnospiraceae bacterium]|jgi:hypothetical protein|nr:hypothetical protein [Lachnospiraceae bacterium]